MADGDPVVIQSKVEFFKPQKVVSAGVGALSDWEIQTGGNPSLSRQRSQALNENGDELNAVQYGAKVSYSESFTAKTIATTQQKTSLDVPAAGAVMSGAHVDSVDVSYSQTAAPSMSVASHKHAAVDGTPSNHDVCRVYTPTVVFPIRAIGVPTTLKDKSNNTIFSTPAGIGIKSIKYGLKVTHVDENDNEGGHLAGQNRDGVETMTLEFTGKVVTSELAIHNSWMLPESDGDSMGNTQSTTKSITISKHIPYDTVNTPQGGEK